MIKIKIKEENKYSVTKRKIQRQVSSHKESETDRSINKIN